MPMAASIAEGAVRSSAPASGAGLLGAVVRIEVFMNAAYGYCLQLVDLLGTGGFGTLKPAA